MATPHAEQISGRPCTGVAFANSGPEATAQGANRPAAEVVAGGAASRDRSRTNNLAAAEVAPGPPDSTWK